MAGMKTYGLEIDGMKTLYKEFATKTEARNWAKTVCASHYCTENRCILSQYNERGYVDDFYFIKVKEQKVRCERGQAFKYTVTLSRA